MKNQFELVTTSLKQFGPVSKTSENQFELASLSQFEPV